MGLAGIEPNGPCTILQCKSNVFPVVINQQSAALADPHVRPVRFQFFHGTRHMGLLAIQRSFTLVPPRTISTPDRYLVGGRRSHRMFQHVPDQRRLKGKGHNGDLNVRFDRRLNQLYKDRTDVRQQFFQGFSPTTSRMNVQYRLIEIQCQKIYSQFVQF
eukprot:scaffold1319_cov126-Cylindrotheca_fusiformis.AAC.4